MIDAIRAIIARLRKDAGEESMSSVQINSDGICILRTGLGKARHLNAEQFMEFCGQPKLKYFTFETYVDKGEWKRSYTTTSVSIEQAMVDYNRDQFWRSEAGDAWAVGISWRVREATNVEIALANERHEFLVEQAEEQFGENRT